MADHENDAKETKHEKDKKGGIFGFSAKKVASDVSKDVGEKVIGEVGKQVGGMLNLSHDRFDLFGHISLLYLSSHR